MAGNRCPLVVLLPNLPLRVVEIRPGFVVVRSGFVVALGLMLGTIAVCQDIPSGTVLPMMTSNTVDSPRSKLGDRLSGRLMQNVVLPSGAIIRARARIEGQVLVASEPTAPFGARLVVRFNYLISDGKKLPIDVSLRSPGLNAGRLRCATALERHR